MHIDEFLPNFCHNETSDALFLFWSRNVKDQGQILTKYAKNTILRSFRDICGMLTDFLRSFVSTVFWD